MSRLPSSETDSLAVLDALLKLTKSSQNTADGPNHSGISGSSSSSHPQSDAMNLLRSPGLQGFGSPFSSAAAAAYLASSRVAIHPNLLGTSANMAGMFPLSSSSHPHSLFSPSQLAAATLMTPATTSFSQQMHTVQQAAATLSTNSGSLSATNPKRTDASYAGRNSSGVSRSSSSPVSASSVNKEEDLRVDDPIIRQEKVVAALHSKPQRGKRRYDLSEKERMELTRTRNREHAKSTRLRKKARYQELLDSEELLKKFHLDEALRQDRLASIEKFLAVRGAMLNENGNEPSTSPSANVELLEIVDHLGSFQYEIHGHKSSISVNASPKHRQAAFSRMMQWDYDIRARYHKSEGSTFHYKLGDGKDGIATSKNGSGFTRVDLVVNQPSHSTGESSTKLVLSGILTVRFASTSSRLSSATWTTSQYIPSFSVDSIRQEDQQDGNGAAAAPSDGDEPSSSSSETLETQMIHPSVVSLDLKASHADTTESNGPGMSI